jgi:hypothetical protein
MVSKDTVPALGLMISYRMPWTRSEVGTQVDRERRHVAVRLPHERFDERLDRRIVESCPFHGALIGVR